MALTPYPPSSLTFVMIGIVIRLVVAGLILVVGFVEPGSAVTLLETLQFVIPAGVVSVLRKSLILIEDLAVACDRDNRLHNFPRGDPRVSGSYLSPCARP